ncbi:hypothetical protein [Sphingomonas sp. CCH5-D11]|uniref:hypothetical protein n=1 Tax=Sphingomonas sp. CCH5-D11 TaxID=1768786 RepID=UPI000B222668|nr:hypothetical protein [Sphingomonas sp. CCH5-D11]
MILRAFLSSLVPGLLITGCTAPASYPSLLPRPAESQSLEEPAAAATTEASKPDPEVDAKIAETTRLLAERSAAFEAASSRAERLVTVAKGAAAGSEAWLNAHVALAEMDELRSSTADIAVTLDDLARERALSLASDYPPLTQAADQARAAIKAQAERISSLQGRLSPA